VLAVDLGGVQHFDAAGHECVQPRVVGDRLAFALRRLHTESHCAVLGAYDLSRVFKRHVAGIAAVLLLSRPLK
jgi:hypothetical protein